MLWASRCFVAVSFLMPVIKPRDIEPFWKTSLSQTTLSAGQVYDHVRVSFICPATPALCCEVFAWGYWYSEEKQAQGTLGYRIMWYAMYLLLYGVKPIHNVTRGDRVIAYLAVLMAAL